MTNLIATFASSPSVGFFNSAKKTAPSLPPPIFFTILKSFRVLVDDASGETELGSVVEAVSCVVLSVVVVVAIDGFETDATSSVVLPLSEGVGVLITPLVDLSVDVSTMGVVESSLIADIFYVKKFDRLPFTNGQPRLHCTTAFY